MIFCDRLLYLHVPKTGGMSATHYLLEVLPRPVYYTRDRRKRAIPDGVIDRLGKRHETLNEAQDIVREYGFELADFPVITATMRNPYDLEVSRYTHYHKPWVVARGNRSSRIAMEEDFTTFVRKTPPHSGRSLDRYFLMNGRLPRNMAIMRFERLGDDLAQILSAAGIRASGELPRLNTSRHDHFTTYYTNEAEEAVYRKYRWVFDSGYYQRLTPDNDAPELQRFGQKIPLGGPVLQVGPSSGLSPELAVDGRLVFSIKAKEPLTRMRIEGHLPAIEPEPIAFVVKLAERSRRTIAQPGHFVWEFSCELKRGARMEIEISAIHDAETSDQASGPPHVAFTLSEIVFGT